jgi:glycosyltransferase involved in cell wall biosynthesis
MPTCNRRAFVPRAIAYFVRQDYPWRELIILDDGSDPVQDLVPVAPDIRYVRLSPRISLGAKRNLACELARGEFIMHWDDDDWMAPHRLRYQVGALLSEAGEVCGLRQMLFYDLTSGLTWVYDYPARERTWLAGGSLLYTRDFWRRAPFPETGIGEDTRFLWSKDLSRAVVLRDYRFYVALIHSHNTCPKTCQGEYWSGWPESLPELLGKDWAFYQDMARVAVRGRTGL